MMENRITHKECSLTIFKTHSHLMPPFQTAAKHTQAMDSVQQGGINLAL